MIWLALSGYAGVAIVGWLLLRARRKIGILEAANASHRKVVGVLRQQVENLTNPVDPDASYDELRQAGKD